MGGPHKGHLSVHLVSRAGGPAGQETGHHGGSALDRRECFPYALLCLGEEAVDSTNSWQNWHGPVCRRAADTTSGTSAALALARLLRSPERTPTFDHGFNVAQQMLPTELPPLGRKPSITTPAVHHQLPSEALPQQLLRNLGTAREPHHKDRDPGRDRCPEPGPLLGFMPACQPFSSTYTVDWTWT